MAHRPQLRCTCCAPPPQDGAAGEHRAVSGGGQRWRSAAAEIATENSEGSRAHGGTARRRLSHVDNRSLESFNGLRRDGLDADLWCQWAGWSVRCYCKWLAQGCWMM